MPEVRVYACDNPNCVERKPIERGYKVPALWLKTTSNVEGAGHTVTVITCSIDCAGPAVKDAYKQLHIEQGT